MRLATVKSKVNQTRTFLTLHLMAELYCKLQEKLQHVTVFIHFFLRLPTTHNTCENNYQRP